jgi:hypothetical protein
MSESNPYVSPSVESRSGSWRLVDIFVVGLWVAIPTGVFVGRLVLLPVFEDFGVSLPIVTQYLLNPYAAPLLAVVTVIVLLGMFLIADGSSRRLFVWLACGFGAVAAVICLAAFVGPALSLWQNLK